MIHRFLNVVCSFAILIKFSQRYIANMIGTACNSRIPQANLHAVLKFVHERIPSIILFIIESFVGAIVQNELRLTEKNSFSYKKGNLFATF